VSGFPPASKAAGATSELDELIASVGALREELTRRFLPGAASARQATSPQPAAPADDRWLERLRDAALGELAELDPARWLDRLRARLGVPVPADASEEVDVFGRDRRYLERARPLLDLLYERWWRVQVTGLELVPDAARVLFVANRSGILPYDALMLAHALEREHPSHRRPRFLLTDWPMAWPFAQPILTRLGAVRACAENADRVLARDEWLAVFPEGHGGALKPFAHRYRLQRFGRGGFAALALRRRAPIVPVAIVGAEEVHPLVNPPHWLQQLLGRSGAALPLPLLGPLGLVPLPSQWRIRFGAPLDLGAAGPAAADDPLFLSRARERVRSAIQELLDEEVERRYSVWS
jgi:1-acyl-sn-glycerol-3-phosphate acyltransferase